MNGPWPTLEILLAHWSFSNPCELEQSAKYPFWTRV